MSELSAVIVDDDPFDCELLDTTFGQLAFPVATTFIDDGRAAYERLSSGELRPDVVMVDLNLPGMLGTDLISRLRENPATATLHVVVLSSSATSWDVRNAYQAGADAYHVKPFDVADMRDLLETIMRYWGRLVARRPPDGTST
ncbi:MAG: response regulator [Actinomycetota bacterium]